jgi:hypothetical protein
VSRCDVGQEAARKERAGHPVSMATSRKNVAVPTRGLAVPPLRAEPDGLRAAVGV